MLHTKPKGKKKGRTTGHQAMSTSATVSCCGQSSTPPLLPHSAPTRQRSSVLLADCIAHGTSPHGCRGVGVVCKNTAGRWSCMLSGSIPTPVARPHVSGRVSQFAVRTVYAHGHTPAHAACVITDALHHTCSCVCVSHGSHHALTNPTPQQQHTLQRDNARVELCFCRSADVGGWVKGHSSTGDVACLAVGWVSPTGRLHPPHSKVNHT